MESNPPLSTPNHLQDENVELRQRIAQLESEVAESERVNEMLRDSEERLELALEGAGLGSWDWDLITGAVVRDERWASMLGYNLEEVDSSIMKWQEMIHPDDLPEALRATEEHQAGCTPFFRMEHRMRAKNGEWKWILNWGKVVERDSDGKPLRATGTHLDITDHRQAEDNIKIFRTFSDRAVHGNSIVDLQGNITYINDYFARAHGYTPEELIGQNLTVFHNEKQIEIIRPLIRSLIEMGEHGPVEVWHTHKNGTEFPMLMSGVVILDNNGEPECLAALAIDISERIRAREALRESEERFRMIYEYAPVLINSFDENGRCVLWNEECRKTFGWTIEELREQNDALVLFYPDPKIREKVKQSVTEKPDACFEEWHPLTKEGKTLSTMWANFRLPDGMVLSLGYDTTERMQMEKKIKNHTDDLEELVQKRTEQLEQASDQLIRSERLAAAGQLAVSIAHEINSPLQAVAALLDSMTIDYGENQALLENLKLMKNGYDSVGLTVKRLLDLNRPGMERKQPTIVNTVIENVVSLLRSHLKSNRVKVVLRLSPQIPSLISSPQQLGHVFLNIINNAVEAIAGRFKSDEQWRIRSDTAGEILIETHLKKNRIIITISDDGPGIAKEDIEHLFDPFFTRKKKLGTGIGLSICYGSIEDHGGSIEASNAAQGGAVFTITLPVE
jgi:PAS domain S-box-containing protein